MNVKLTTTTRVASTAVATAAIAQVPLVQDLLHLAYITATLAVCFICGMLIAHSIWRYIETGWAEKHCWSIRNFIQYVEPANGAFWISGWGGKVLSLIEGDTKNINYLQ